LDFVHGYESVSTKTNWKFNWNLIPWPTLRIHSRGNLWFQRETFTRSVLSEFPLPELYGKENPFSTTHILNAAALGRAVTGGR
jgi:hypothetical protein